MLERSTHFHPRRVAAAAVGLAAASYATCAGLAWYRYGRPAQADSEYADRLLDQFMPECDVVERHHVRIDAPADIAFAAARDQDLLASPVIRAIFKARELVLGSTPDDQQRPRAFLPLMVSVGWGLLAEVPGRELVMGGYTQPWEANVTFRSLLPDHFAAFQQPGYVKIVFSLRADPAGDHASIFRTETRAVATDAVARAKFRRYWSFASPGIGLIRWASLAPLKKEAERRARLVG